MGTWCLYISTFARKWQLRNTNTNPLLFTGRYRQQDRCGGEQAYDLFETSHDFLPIEGQHPIL